MIYNKNCPAQTKNEQPKAKRTIDRVMSGESFRITTDRMGFTYRFQKEDDVYQFFINDLRAGESSRGCFLKIGFAVTLKLIGDNIFKSVLYSDIRFDERGGVLC